MDLRTMIIQFKEARAERASLEAKAKELKAKEDDLKAQILEHMQADGVQSVKYPDVGHVVITTKDHYEVRDKEWFCQTIISALLDAYKDGRPLDDGLIVQARPSKEPLETYLEKTHTELSSTGLVKISKPELTIRKA